MATNPQYEHPPREDGAQINSAIPTVYYNHISLYGLLFLGLGCSTEAPTRPVLMKPRTTRDWDERKETIRDLYIAQNMSLKDVARIMTEKHHFSATERQYKVKFAVWNWKKYNRRDKEMKQWNEGFAATLPEALMGKRPIRCRHSTVSKTTQNHGHTIGSQSSSRLQYHETFPNILLFGCKDDQRASGLFFGLRDLLHGTSRINPRWRQVGGSWWLPDAGEHLVSVAILAIRRFNTGEIKLGGHAFRQAFRGIEDVIDKDALTIFQSLFLEIPLRLLETGNILMTRIYTHYLWKMLQAKKREEPITQMAEMLHAISISTPEALLYYLRQMHLILADILTQIRGDIDYNTINARMRTLHLQQNYGCDVSQSYLECLDSFGVLARNSTTKFGGLAYEMSRVEVRRTQANIQMTHAPIALKELSDRSLAELMAGDNHSAFLQTSRSISDLAQYAVATFFIHECLIQYGDLDGGSMCLMRIIETLERAQEVSSDGVIKLYLAGQLLRVRLKLADILTVSGKFDEAATVMEHAHIMRYIGELI